MKAKTITKWLLVFLLCIPAIYLAIQIYRVLDSNYTTQLAERYVMSDSIACRGIVGMSETEIPYDGSGVLSYTVENGERVSVGGTVAMQFATPQEAQTDIYVRTLAKELETLARSQGNTTGTDAEALLRQRYTGAYDILDCVESGNYAELADAKAQVQLAENRLQLVTGRALDFMAYMQTLQASHDALQVGGTAVGAPVSGYFVAGKDSKVRQYDLEQLTQMSPQELQEAAQQESVAAASNVAGKLIADYKWQFFTTVTVPQADKIEQAANLSVSFAGSTSGKIPATVQSIVRDEENNLAKIELVCDYINADVVTQEHADAILYFRDYEGLRINRNAERYQGDVRGVYVRSGNVVYFKRIEPIFEDETYYLVPLTPDDPKTVETPVNEVNMFDTIIVEGKNLADGKML